MEHRTMTKLQLDKTMGWAGVALWAALAAGPVAAADVKVLPDSPELRAKRKVVSSVPVDLLREAQNAVRHGQDLAPGAELVVPMPAACAAKGCPSLRLEIQDDTAERLVELSRASDGAYVIRQADVDQFWARKLALVALDSRAPSAAISFGVRWQEDSHKLSSVGHAMLMCEVQKVQVGEMSTWGRMRTLGMRSLEKMCEAGAASPVSLLTRVPDGLAAVDLEENGRTLRLRLDLKSKDAPDQAGRPALVHVPLAVPGWSPAARLVYKAEAGRR